MKRCFPIPIARNYARRSWYGRRCCASSTASIQATRLENSGFQRSIGLTTSALRIQNAAQFRAAFSFSDRTVLRLAAVSYFGRPYDLEPLEHGFGLVVHPKALSGRAP